MGRAEILTIAHLVVAEPDRRSRELGSTAMHYRPNYMDACIVLVSALGYLGRVDDIDPVLEGFEAFRIETIPNWRLLRQYESSATEQFLDGLRKAGLPE